ncbi:MAG: tetratricopeptide repeat protein [candidate division Zixibacteria bacterium]|nr:tetratricopeptide repeat protein [candidate division Zixibacteria bacterium]
MTQIQELEAKLITATGESKVDILNELASSLHMSDPEKSKQYAEVSLSLANELGYESGMAKSLVVWARINWIRGKYEDAEEKYFKALGLFEKTNDKKGVAICLLRIGRICWDKNDFGKALEHFINSAKISEAINDPDGVAESYMDIAYTYWQREENDKSKEYLFKALEIHEKSGNKRTLATIYNRIGIIYGYTEQQDEALEYYYKALAIMEELNELKCTNTATIYNNISHAHIEKSNYEKALDFGRKAFQLAEEIGYKEILALAQTNIGYVLAKFHKYESAITSLENGLKLFREMNLKPNELNSLELMADLYDETGEHEKALSYTRRLMVIKEQLFDEKKNKQIVELQTRYESEKSKRETEIYRLKNVELASEITERKKAETELKKYQGDLEELVKGQTEELRLALDEVETLKNRLQEENIYLQEEIKLEHNFNEIVGRSSKLNEVLEKIEQVASTDSTVLILGETGTGKELIARAIHGISERKNRPLVKVNCAALPVNLIESELFGHEKGAFTGAYSRKIGRFQLADKGTILLDEIGEIPLELQAKLLRVLQEGEFEHIGGSKVIKVDVRVIAITNRNLDQAIRDGKFRDDLFYRLNVFPVNVPSLRERKPDIPMLVNHFILKYAKKTNKTIDKVPQELMSILESYSWPGNIRELENTIERSVIISKGNKFELAHLHPNDSFASNDLDLPSFKKIEKEYILKVLKKTKWKIRGKNGAAEVSGLKPTTLESRMKKLGIERTNK